MKRRTAVALFVVLASLGTAAVAGLAAGGPTLVERWVSDTARDNRVNHHAVGVGPDGTVVAPVAEVAGTPGLGPTSCALVRLAPETGAVRWRAGVPPTNCTTHALTRPAVVDVDGDGASEVIAASTERALHVRSAATGEEAWRVPLGSYGYGRPTVADLTPAPGREIVVSDIGGTVVLVANRTARWRRHLDDSTWAPPIVADVDGDGDREIVVGTNAATVALSTAGDVEWRSPLSAVTVSLGPSTAEGRLVIGAEAGTVRGVAGRTGERVWNHTVDGVPKVGDVSPTTRLVYVGVAGGVVRALDARTGEERWSTAVVAAERGVTPPPVLGDVDGDGREEVVAVVGDGTVAILDPATGAELARYERDVPIWTHATVADVGGDRAEEVFVRYGDGRVVALAYR